MNNMLIPVISTNNVGHNCVAFLQDCFHRRWISWTIFGSKTLLTMC